MKESFVFYKSFYDAINKVPPEYQLELYNAILSYSFEGLEPNKLSPVAEAMFILMKPNIDSSLKRYEAKVVNGRKGGRPKKETEEKPKRNLKETEQKAKQKQDYNYNVNDNENYNVNDDVTANDSCVDGLQNNVGESCVDGLQEIINFYNDNIGLMTPYAIQTLEVYLNDMEYDVIIFAMEKAVEANVRTLQYIKGTLNNWKNSGIKTLIQAKEANQKFQNSKKVTNKTEKDQRQYDNLDFLYSNLNGVESL